MQYTFGFIGVGNMGAALARAACRWKADRVVVTNRTLEKAAALAEELDCDLAMSNEAVAAEAQYLFLGVKPHQMAGLLSELAPILAEREEPVVLVSMAAGITTEQIEQMAGFPAPIIRIMPNTPVAVGEGLIPYSVRNTLPEETEDFCEKMAGAGQFDPIDEELMDSAAALAGCGPAFVCAFLEALADGAVACGLPRGKALNYAAKTLIGTAELLVETGKHPGELKDQVCSPGGSTIAGVRALEQGGLRSAAMEAVIAAYEKNGRLGKE